MAVNFASMLLQPTKATPWDLTPTPGADSAREQLKLAREKFDWERKQAEENKRLEREKLNAQMAAKRLEEANIQAAKLKEDRLKVYGEFTKANGEGNYEGARAMVPMMQSLGMGVELEGEEGGLPRYRVDLDAEEAAKAEAEQLAKTSPYDAEEAPEGAYGSMEEGLAAPDGGETAEQSLSRLSAMGLGGETGSLLPPLGIRGSGEVDPTTGRSVAERVAATYGTPGEKTATRGPDTEDFTGGVPKNVIDTGASAAATLHRLDPSLKAAAAAYPDAQTSAAAEQLRLGLRASGLPLEKQMEAFEKGISGPASQRNAQIGAQAQADRFRESRDELTEKDVAKLQKDGRQEGTTFARDNKVTDIARAFRAGDTILKVIDDPNTDNDAMIASELMTFQNVKGTPSDTDLKLSFGIPLSSTIDQALSTIGQMVKGGMQKPQREAIKAYMKAKQSELRDSAFEFLDQANLRADGGAMNEHAKKAYLQSIKSSVPGWIYNDWLDMKKARDEGAAGDKPSSKGGKYDPDSVNGDLAGMSDVDLELEGQALEAGLDPDVIRPLMRTESGGNPKAKNRGSSASGLFQFTDDTARAAGLKNAAEYAALPPAEQIRLGIERFKRLGLDENSTRDDFALANAAPAYVGKPDALVIKEYKAGTPRGDEVRAKNPGWIPPGGGDITVGSIKRFYRGGSDKGGKASKLPEPKSALDKSVLDILRRAGD
jgi:soluble lytic murein transglycosylase-like protein